MSCDSGHSPSPPSPSITGLRFQQVSTTMLALMWKGSPAPHFCDQLALWSRSLLPHHLAPFLDRPYALLQGPHVSVGLPALFTLVPGASPPTFPQPLEPAASEWFPGLRLEEDLVLVSVLGSGGLGATFPTSPLATWFCLQPSSSVSG